jgi:ABC-2 type transport system permease protein
VRRFVADTRVIAHRNVRTLMRTPQIVVFSSIQPIMFVLLFVYVFGGSIRIPGYGNYVDYLIPGIIAQTTLFGGSALAIVIAEDSQKGIIDRFRSLPMSRTAILAGATVASLVRNLVTLTVVMIIGMIVGFRFHTSAPQVLLALFVALLFGQAWAWVFALIGISVRNTEAAQLASFLPIFPLVFAASTFTSPATMPPWLRWFAEHQPVTYTVNAVRALTQGVEPAGPAVLGSVLWSVAILTVAATLAVHRFRSL